MYSIAVKLRVKCACLCPNNELLIIGQFDAIGVVFAITLNNWLLSICEKLFVLLLWPCPCWRELVDCDHYVTNNIAARCRAMTCQFLLQLHGLAKRLTSSLGWQIQLPTPVHHQHRTAWRYVQGARSSLPQVRHRDWIVLLHWSQGDT